MVADRVGTGENRLLSVGRVVTGGGVNGGYGYGRRERSCFLERVVKAAAPSLSIEDPRDRYAPGPCSRAELVPLIDSEYFASFFLPDRSPLIDVGKGNVCRTGTLRKLLDDVALQVDALRLHVDESGCANAFEELLHNIRGSAALLGAKRLRAAALEAQRLQASAPRVKREKILEIAAILAETRSFITDLASRVGAPL